MALEQELRWLRAYALLTYPFACVPFLFLFFADHGMNAGQYGEVLTAYYVTMFLAEVPTGMLADRFGTRGMLVLGPLILAAGFGIIVANPTYSGFLVGEMLLGLGHSVLSGPPTVALYDTLQRHDQEHRYLAEESRIHARRLYGTGSAFLLGGLLVYFGNASGTAYTAAIAATCVLHLLAACFATRLSNPKKTLRAERPDVFLGHAREELKKPAVRWLLLYWVVLFTLLRFPFHNYQPYLKAAGEIEPLLANAIVIGSVFAVLNLVAAPLSSYVPKLVERFGRRALFWWMPLTLSASLLVMAFERMLAADGESSRTWCWIGISMFFVQQVPFAMHWSLLHEFVNHRIGSAARTTVLSVISLGARAVYALVNLQLFHLQARSGLATALATTAVCGAVATVGVLWLRPRGLLRGQHPIE
ncbi:MAG: MFS family permease [Planctomycetota bacterium]